MDELKTGVVEWAVASVALEPSESGDAYLVQPTPQGVRLALVDGIGHGREAALAARTAIGVLEQDSPPVELLRRCHAGLQPTRGAVLITLWIDSRDDRLEWLGVGDVRGVLLHGSRAGGVLRRGLVGQAGVVGRLLPVLRVSTAALAPGDLLVLTTDGIRRQFEDRLEWRGPPQRIADDLVAQHWTGGDDAMVLVARYHGGPR